MFAGSAVWIWLGAGRPGWRWAGRQGQGPIPMRQRPELLERIRKIVARDPRYRPEAYDFVRGALDCAGKILGVRGHLTGGQLLEGVRWLAIESYGPMARTVLEHWGVRRTEDIGEIVFNMVDIGLLSRTEGDSREDFSGVFDFADVFERDYPWHGRR